MSDYVGIFKTEENRNWLKAVTAVQITKDGLSVLVKDVITQLQKDFLQHIRTKNGLPDGTSCTSCNTANVLPCQTYGLCRISKSKPCTFHGSRQVMSCVNKICSDFQVEIQRVHRFWKPSWKNTNASAWCTNAWELAKCFLPPSGYQDINCIEETDFNGIVNIIINCKAFNKHFADNLDNDNNIIIQGRDVGRKMRHLSSLSVNSADLQEYIATLKDILNNVNGRQRANDAIKQLSLLEKDELSISSADMSKAITETIRDTRHILNEAKDLNLDAKIEHLELLEKEVALRIKTECGNAVTEIKKATLSMTDQATATIKEESDAALERIRGSTCVRMMEDTISQSTRGTTSVVSRGKDVKPIKQETDVQKYVRTKQEFKEDIETFYQNQHSVLPFSPLHDEQVTQLVDIYVPPNISATSTGKGSAKRITSFSEIFTTNMGERFSNIYVSGKAGVGKTSFCNYITTLWCLLNLNLTNEVLKLTRRNYFKYLGDIVELQKFDFLFLIVLRVRKQKLNDVDEMIRNLIVKHLSRGSNYGKKFLQKVFHNERCLIILDGLDQWIHPYEQIPQCKARRKWTILMTSRPWKLCDLRPKESERDNFIEIEGIDSFSQTVLSQNASHCLQGKECQKFLEKLRQMQTAAFGKPFASIAMTRDLSSLLSTPVFLLHLLCVWTHTKSFGNSLCQMYINILDVVFARVNHKTDRHLKYQTQQLSCSLPRCFHISIYSNAFPQTLINIGQLAYNTLFCQVLDDTIDVFDQVTVNRFLRKDVDLPLALETGLLSKRKRITGYHRPIEYTFVHGTVREMLCAVYMASSERGSKQYKNILDTIKKRIDTTTKVLAMSTIFKFLSGMNPDLAKELSMTFSDILTTEMDGDEKDFREHVLSVQTFLHDCCIECQNNGYEELIFPMQHVVVSSCTVGDIPLNIPLVSFLQTTFPCKEPDRKTHQLLQISKNTLKFLDVQFTYPTLCADIASVQSLVRLNMFCISLSEPLMLPITLTHLSLVQVSLQDKQLDLSTNTNLAHLEILETNVQFVSIWGNNVESLEIGFDKNNTDCAQQEHGIVKMAGKSRLQKSLHCLCMENIKFYSNGISVSCFPNLCTLNFYDCQIEESMHESGLFQEDDIQPQEDQTIRAVIQSSPGLAGCASMSKVISHPLQLKCVRICQTSISNALICNLLTGLSDCTQPFEFEVDRCTIISDGQRMGCEYSYEGRASKTPQIKDSINHNFVDLKSLTMSSQCFMTLVAVLKQVPHSITIRIDRCIFAEDDKVEDQQIRDFEQSSDCSTDKEADNAVLKTKDFNQIQAATFVGQFSGETVVNGCSKDGTSSEVEDSHVLQDNALGQNEGAYGGTSDDKSVPHTVQASTLNQTEDCPCVDASKEEKFEKHVFQVTEIGHKCCPRDGSLDFTVHVNDSEIPVDLLKWFVHTLSDIPHSLVCRIEESALCPLNEVEEACLAITNSGQFQLNTVRFLYSDTLKCDITFFSK